MKIAFLFLLLAITSCSKKKEYSQEDQERTTTLAANQYIENEHGGLRFFLDAGQVEVTSATLKFTAKERYRNYGIEAKDIPNNSTHQVTFTGSGTFNLEVEGWTALANTKRFKLQGMKAGDQLTIQKGIVLYTFTKR